MKRKIIYAYTSVHLFLVFSILDLNFCLLRSNFIFQIYFFSIFKVETRKIHALFLVLHFHDGVAIHNYFL